MITIASCTMGLCSSGKEISLERKPHYVKKSGAGTQMQCAFCIAYTYILPIPKYDIGPTHVVSLNVKHK